MDQEENEIGRHFAVYITWVLNVTFYMYIDIILKYVDNLFEFRS